MIENTSTLDKKAQMSLARYPFRRNHTFPVLIVTEILMIALAAAWWSFDLDVDLDGIMTFGLVFPAVTGLLSALFLAGISRAADKNPHFPALVHYTFDDREMEIRTEDPLGTSESRYGYAFLYRVFVDVEYIYLYPNRTTAFCVAKSGFTSGTAEELYALLRKNGVKIRGLRKS